jgi:Trypsin-like serine proteases, typically periplasmic, contain C-terminal PDZ domain
MNDRGRWWVTGLIAVAAVVLVGILMLGATGCANLGTSKGSVSTIGPAGGVATAATVDSVADASVPVSPGLLGASPAETVASAVGPSVVNIAVEGVAQGAFGSQQYSAEGSGVIFSADGYIVTNNHVVSDSSGGTDVPVDKVTVTFATGEKLPATIVGRDPLTDLAVIKVNKTGLPAAKFIERFGLVKVGQYAIAIGSPLGLKNSVTLGIVSGLAREIDTSGTEQFALIDLIQTDAAISPGNSGGALVDAQGRVIGINVAYLPPNQTGAQNLGFAIPSDLAKDVATEIIKTGKVRHAYLGIQNQTVTEQLQQQFGLSRSSGVLVGGAGPGTPAATAGLKQGDIIVKVDATTITNDADLYAILRAKKPGDVVSVTFDRDGKEQTVQVTLGERPQ